ncbi:MAG: siderophore-interacting protein, partial [Myxococcales bacterium]
PGVSQRSGWSSSGESTTTQESDELFAFIAGESAMVTNLRRALVKEVGVDRSQVAFMGYWRRGVAMKS